MGDGRGERLIRKAWIAGGDMLKKAQSKGRIFSPIRTSKISDEVYKQLVSLISGGHLKPGEKLPSEREMASDLGISRQSIREALYRAEIMGLIEVRQGEGSFVLSSIREPLKSPLLVLLEEEAGRIFEFLEVRKLIEGWCAEKAATEATAEDLEKMEGILEKMERSAPGDREWETMDVKFHLAIAAATHNVIAIHIMEALKESFGSFFTFRKVLTKPERKELLWQHHDAIYRAISQRDRSLAKRKLIYHLDFIEKKIKEEMEKMQM
jgi:GntR family transcriptional repressor for pyruvate dehydrogenase complex